MNEPVKASQVRLADGSKVVIRQVRREDAPLLAEAFARFSTESRRLRFLTVKSRLTEAELRYFTRVDHHDHEALGAVDEAGGRALGSAATSGTPRTRRWPRLRWPSSTTGRVGASAPSC